MRQPAVGSRVDLNGATQPIGIITDLDFMERVVAEARDATSTLVGEIVTCDQ